MTAQGHKAAEAEASTKAQNSVTLQAPVLSGRPGLDKRLLSRISAIGTSLQTRLHYTRRSVQSNASIFSVTISQVQGVIGTGREILRSGTLSTFATALPVWQRIFLRAGHALHFGAMAHANAALQEAAADAAGGVGAFAGVDSDDEFDKTPDFGDGAIAPARRRGGGVPAVVPLAFDVEAAQRAARRASTRNAATLAMKEGSWAAADRVASRFIRF